MPPPKFFCRFQNHDPPWWPDNPSDRPRHWRGGRDHFVRRIGCLFSVLLLIFFVLPVLIGGLFFGLGVNRHEKGEGPPTGIVIIAAGILIIVGLRTLQSLKRTGVVVGEVMDAANSVANGNYDAHVDERGSPEVRQLASAFNTMTERLAVNENQRQAMQADSAHELRTPLAVIRGNIEAMIDGLYQPSPEKLTSLLSQTETMTKLLEDLQLLSLADSGSLTLHRELVDLSEMVDMVLASFEYEFSSHGMSGSSQIPQNLELEIDPLRFRQILENLVQNAIRHNPEGTRVTISADADGSTTTLRVADNGAGIEQARLDTIFDRYSKAADSQGSGLGLAISQRLIHAHGGAVSVRSQVGAGTTFEVTLPSE